jgi:hypothetical protein
MPCHWFKNGMCTSPLLETPSSDPVLIARCLGSSEVYGRCRYYTEPKGESLEMKRAIGVRKLGKPLLLIHSISEPLKSKCDFYSLIRHESGSYLASCSVLGRYLTRYEASLCVKGWEDCPFRKMGIKLKK